MAMEYIVSLMAVDRVGIVADVSRALTGLGGNITDLSQTLLRGYFTLIISAEMPETMTEDSIRSAVQQAGSPREFEVGVMPYTAPEPVEPPDAEHFVLTTRGKDRPGIILRVTSYLRGKSINIEDFYAQVVEGDLLMVITAAVPTQLNIHDVQRDIEQVGKEFGLTVHLQHENIFRVTNEVRPVRSLRTGASRSD